jgi:hypothetical protein
MRNYLKTIVMCISLCILILSCDKKKEITSEEGIIYMTQAIDARSSVNLLIADTAQSFTFGGAYGGQLYPQQDVQLNFKIDTGLIASYNASHSTAYKNLPVDKYTISGLNAVIKAGRTTSDGIKVTVSTKSLPKDAEYLLPVILQSASSGVINEDLRTAYFKIKISRKETDLTESGALSVSKDNGGGPDAGEGSKKLVDNNLGTKFLTDGFPIVLWMQLKFPQPVSIQAYKLTSGNDASERDPKSWKLLGSNDGATWTELDKRINQSFSGRTQTIMYEFNNDASYSYYRWQVDENNGNNLFQITEWRLITFK